MRGRYRTLLAIPGFRSLLVVSLVARLPLGTTSLSVLLLAREHSGSYGVAGIAVGAFAFASAAAAPVQGILVDRLGPRRVLPLLALPQTVLLVLLAVVNGTSAPDVVLVVLAAACGILTPPVTACVRVLWPRITRDRAELDSAYALDAVTQETIFVAGPLLVGGLVIAGGPVAGVLASAALTLGGTAGFVRLPIVAGQPPSPHARPRAGALGTPGLRALLPVVALTGSAIGAVEVGLPALADQVGHRPAAGVLLAVWATGSGLGGLAYGARSWTLDVQVRLRRLLALFAVFLVPLVFAGSLAGGLVLAVLAGTGIAPVLACQNTLTGELAPPGTVTEAFTWNTAALVAGIAGGSAVGGLLVDGASVAPAFVAAVATAALAAGLATLGRRALGAGTVVAAG